MYRFFLFFILGLKAGFHYTRLPCTQKMSSYVQQHCIVVNRMVTDPNQKITAKDLYALTRIRV